MKTHLASGGVRRRARLSLAAVMLMLPTFGLVACSQKESDKPIEAGATSVSSAQPSETKAQPTENAASRPRPTVPTTAESSHDSADPDDPRNWPQCSGLTAQQALNKWVDRVPRYRPDWPWATTWASPEGYDDCAALSYIVISIEGATASSPYQIMLFHNGQYLGTVTKKAFGFGPTVTRESDSLISVVFHWPKPGESNAERSGETYAQFAWDDQQGKVVMTGDAPPGT